MAPRGRNQQVVYSVETPEEVDEWIEKSDQILVVLDLHKTWCGRCMVMDPTFRRIALELDDWERRVKFLSVDTSILTDAQKETLPVNEGCKPSFAVLKHKVVIGRIQGANAPELNTIVMENVFPPPSAEDE